MAKIHVYIKDPGKAPRSVNISASLANLQKTVDGYIEIVPVTDNMVMIVDEEGKLKGKAINFPIAGDIIVGTAVFAGLGGKEGEELVDVPLAFPEFKKLFSWLWEV